MNHNPAKNYVKSTKKVNKKTTSELPKKGSNTACPIASKCGGCQLQHMEYARQLAFKQRKVEELLKDLCPVKPIIGMEDPLHYRNKVHAVFGTVKGGKIISGIYEEKTHKIVPVEDCMIEDQKADAIIKTIRELLPSFKIRVYNEDTGYGLFRHVLVRTGRFSGEIMVVLVLSSPILPSKNNFVKALRKMHPEISTVVMNVNDKKTSMVLGDRNITLYGKGYIEDELCGLHFRISPNSFYQVNPIQTQNLYAKAMELAGLSGREVVIDAYCGTGTIGMIAAKDAAQVIGVELNRDAVKDAIANAKGNQISNIRFVQGDAGEFMEAMATGQEHVDVVLMDPPRSGSTDKFIQSVKILSPDRVVYVSCNPETLARDLKIFQKKGYQCKVAYPVDMFPHTAHVETVVLLNKKHVNPKAYVEIGVDAEEYYKIKGEKH